MSLANPALWVAIGGCITALATLVGMIRHVNGPAHSSTTAQKPPQA